MSDSFTQKLTQALENLARLEIVTAVGAVTVDPRAVGSARYTLAAGAKVMHTSIDLLQGDIVTQIDPAFLTGELAPLRDFHAAREAQSSALIKGNVEALGQLLALAERLAGAAK
jgi:hypothetical protein